MACLHNQNVHSKKERFIQKAKATNEAKITWHICCTGTLLQIDEEL